MEVRMESLKHLFQLNILLGAWLIAAPFVLDYSGSSVAMRNDVAIGVVLVACSWWLLAVTTGRIAADVFQLLGGLWLIAAPFVWHYGQLSRPFGNDILVGICSVLVSATSLWILNARSRRPA